jgi:hypothetical protein
MFCKNHRELIWRRDVENKKTKGMQKLAAPMRSFLVMQKKNTIVFSEKNTQLEPHYIQKTHTYIIFTNNSTKKPQRGNMGLATIKSSEKY